MGVGSVCGVDGVRAKGVGGVRSVGVGVGDGDANLMGNVGGGNMGADDAGGVGMDGLVLAWVTSGLPWTREVAVSRASWHGLPRRRLYLLIP